MKHIVKEVVSKYQASHEFEEFFAGVVKDFKNEFLMSEEMEELTANKATDLIVKYEEELKERFLNVDLSFAWEPDTPAGVEEAIPIVEATFMSPTKATYIDKTAITT